MSFTANTAFEARITNGRFDDLANVTGKYYVSTTATDCSAGFLVTKDSLLDCEGFTGVKNENSWKMVAAANTATIDTPVYACNPYDTPLAAVGTNLYEVGNDFLGLGIPAGRYGTFTRINFDNVSTYRFGVGNLASSLSTNTYCTIASGQLSPTASAPTTTGAIYFKVVGTGNFVEGTTDSFGYVDVIACSVSTVAG